jgi:hypothetical protein
MTRADRLYDLLPAIYRIKDAGQGEPLKALLAVIAKQINLLEDHIGQTYDNWFIETCEEWLVPYLGDLLGVRPLHPVPSAGVSLRAYVANTLAYRRRKGTLPVLEQLARDTTGWVAHAVEFFQLLATTQHLNHVRPEAPGWVSLKDANRLELVSGPFEQVPYSAEVRRIASGRGKYNIPNVGLFLWRLQAYPIVRSTPRPVADPPDGRYTFSPLGLDTPLFSLPQTEEEITHLAEEVNVSGPLRRRPLYDELVARRKALGEGKTPVSTYFGESPVLEVYLKDQDRPLPPEEIVICNLEGWDKSGWTPPTSTPFASAKTTKVAVDPALGRLCTLQGITEKIDRVSYAYGFSGDLGGGPYNRQAPAIEDWTRPDIWQVGVSQQKPKVATEDIFTTLGDAIQAWNTWSAANPGKPGIIVVMDSATYEEDLTGPQKIEIAEGSRLMLIAADWPVAVDPSTGVPRRTPGQFVPEGVRPHLWGNISVVGTASGNSPNPGQLLINGFLIEGKLNVLAGTLGGLTLSHCTLLPGAGGMGVNPSVDAGKQNARLQVILERCIRGPLKLADTVPKLRISESIVDGAVEAKGGYVQIESSTLLDTTQARTFEVSNTIFNDLVTVTRRQTGCVRFSFVPPGSRTPRRYRCQPDLEIASRIEQFEKSPDFQMLTEGQKKARQDKIRADVVSWLVPGFTSTRYGHPAYGQLSRSCPRQIAEGAEDGSEMGAFGFLKQPQREANLRVVLEEYLRFGLEAGPFYVT